MLDIQIHYSVSTSIVQTTKIVRHTYVLADASERPYKISRGAIHTAYVSD